MKRRAAFLPLGFLLVLGAIGLARAEVVQQANLRVSFEGELEPRALPRAGTAPVRVTVGGTVGTTNRSRPPQLRSVSVAVNRNGRLSPGGLPVCRLAQIQPATTTAALEACGKSLVGRGRFSAKVLLPEQAPFPSDGEVFAFNGTFRGRPAILAHVYGTEPVPTSYTLPFQIGQEGKGDFGTVLNASLPQVTSEWGYVTGFSMTLDRTYSKGGERRGYVSAGCPAPRGFPGAVFPLARTTFAFAGGVRLTKTLVRSCKAIG
jgi:hypothetical protein